MPPQTRPNHLENYVTVAERIQAFYETYPQGRITTGIVINDTVTGYCMMRAEVFRQADDAQPASTGHSYEVKGEGNRQVTDQNHVELAETGAVGRALMLLGFETKRVPGQARESKSVPARSAPETSTVVTRIAGGAPIQPGPVADMERQHAELEAEIRQVAKSLNYTEAHITDHVRRKYEVDGSWSDLSLAIKREVLQALLKKKAPASAA